MGKARGVSHPLGHANNGTVVGSGIRAQPLSDTRLAQLVGGHANDLAIRTMTIAVLVLDRQFARRLCSTLHCSEPASQVLISSR